MYKIAPGQANIPIEDSDAALTWLTACWTKVTAIGSGFFHFISAARIRQLRALCHDAEVMRWTSSKTNPKQTVRSGVLLPHLGFRYGLRDDIAPQP